MNILRAAIRNHQFTLTVFFLLLLVGITSFLGMPRSEDPPMQIPGASVIILYPGSNPADLEQLVASPLEESLNELEDIRRMTTTMRDGILLTSIEFNFKTDAAEKFDEVVQQVNSIRSALPADLYQIEIMEWSSSDVVMMHLALVSESAGFARMEDQGDLLKKSMEKVTGVKRVELIAFPEQELHISLNMEKMARLGVGVEQVSRALISNNASIPGGSIELGLREFNITTSGSYNDLHEIRRTVVSSHQGRNIYLEQIASVRIDHEDIRYAARYLGQRSIFITVQQKEGYNIFSISEQLDRIIDEHRIRLDDDIQLVTVFSQADSVDERINGFLGNLLYGILLVGLIIFLSLGFRASLLVIIAIPFSILIGLGFVDLSGFGLQQMSIAGLVISLGLLVDNSIVVVENIERFISRGETNRDAAYNGSRQLAWPILTATLTTMFAFIPIITMPDKAGRFIQSMPVTVICTLLASLIIALLLTPYLASIFLKSFRKNNRKELNPKSMLDRIIRGPYRKTLLFALDHRISVILAAILLMIAAGSLFRVVGVSFFPKAEKPQFMIRIHAPDGTSLAGADSICRRVEGMLDTLSGVKHYASNIGHGNPRIYYNIFPRRYEKNYAEIFVEMQSYEMKTFDAMIDDLRANFSQDHDARIFIKEFEQGTPIEAPLTLKITGIRLDRLRQISDDFEQFLLAEEGLVNVDNSLRRRSTELFVHINREKAGMLGVSVFEIDRTVRLAMAGIPVSNYRDEDGKEYPMVLKLEGEGKPGIRDFDRIYVSSLSGRMIPLSQLAKLELKEAPGIITHFDMDRNGTLTADLRKEYSLDVIIASLDKQLSRYPLPPGYHYQFTGELESREESFGGMLKASLIALIAIFAVLVLQFRSFRQPFIIFSAFPLAMIGSVLALYITGYSFSFTAFVGLISLIGIVVNNSIILVDYTNKLIEGGMERVEAIRQAGETRFTPIVLTTLTTIGGLLPLTLRGGTLWAPMGWTIIGGLLVSTFMSLLVVPVLYRMYSPRL